MKDFNRLLARGNFTPKERILLLIANTVKLDTTGKEFLTEADKRALGEGWHPANNAEVAEYNRYNRAWKMACTAELDAQTIYLQAKFKHQSMGMMIKDFVFYPVFSEVKQALKELAKIKRVEPKEAIEIVNAQRQAKIDKGLAFKEVIHKLAFEFIGEDGRKKTEELYSDIEQENYLDELEEMISLYDKRDFATMGNRISSKSYNSFAKKHQLFHDYADIGLWDVAKKYAQENNLPIEKNTDEDGLKAIEALAETLNQHAKENKTTIEQILEVAFLKWVNEGFFEKQYIITSEERELVAKWADAKQKAEATLKDLIGKGTLKTGKNTDGDDIITGESLLSCGLDYAFVKDFKEYAEDYEPDLGILKDADGNHRDGELLITKENIFSRYQMHLARASGLLESLNILHEKEENGEIVLDVEQGRVRDLFFKFRNDFVAEYEKLLAFKPLFLKLSKTFEMDLTFRINLWTGECGEMVDSFNDGLRQALKGEQAFYPQGKKHFKDNDLFIDKDKIKPNNPLVELYEKEISTILEGNF